MIRGYTILLVLAGLLTLTPHFFAQTPASGNAAGSGQNKPPGSAQKPAESNPFPEDTSTVPLMPSKDSVALPDGAYSGDENAAARLRGEDTDPVRSPDDPGPSAGSGQDADSSSSQAGLDAILPPGSDDERPDKKRKLTAKDQPHTESATEDVNVAKYYLDSKNWKAALSRFQSAMVLDPENPEVYWGLAEADRHLGDFADARTYYEKLLDYDPEGPHAKEARKALKDPQIANARTPSIGQTTERNK
jgi:tetratricopeptide (TPR) repeat protein